MFFGILARLTTLRKNEYGSLPGDIIEELKRRPLTRILNNNGIRATTRPVKTLQQEFASPKSRPPSDRQTNVVRTAHGITSEKRVDAYTLEQRSTYETPKFLKVVPILPAMHDSKATLLILRMHASSTEAILIHE